MTVGEKIHFYRKSKKMRMRHLPNVPRSHLSEIENNNVNPSIDTILKIAKDLGVPAYWLLLGVDRKCRGDRI